MLWGDGNTMLIDIPVYITVEEGSFKHAEDLVSNIMNNLMAIDPDVEGWRFAPEEVSMP